MCSLRVFANRKSGESSHVEIIRAAHRRWATVRPREGEPRHGDSKSHVSSDIDEKDEDGPTAEERAGAGRVVFPRANSHLYRQLVARGCYSAMLEHFYAAFPSQQLRVLCTEHLAPDSSDGSHHFYQSQNYPHANLYNHSRSRGSGSGSGSGSSNLSDGGTISTSTAAATMRSLASWLGLGGREVQDFEDTVSRGRFNTGENRGYDKLTAWGSGSGSNDHGYSHSHGLNAQQTTTPLSPRPAMPASLKRKLTAFYEPFNERLFELAHMRCPWPGSEDG